MAGLRSAWSVAVDRIVGSRVGTCAAVAICAALVASASAEDEVRRADTAHPERKLDRPAVLDPAVLDPAGLDPSARLTSETVDAQPADGATGTDARAENEGAGSRQGGDTCATATVITSLPFNVAGTTAGFSNDYDGYDQNRCPYFGSTSPEVVYKFTPAVDTDVEINLCNSSYDTKVYVFEGSCGNMIACDDDSCSSLQYRSLLNCLRLLGGVDYYIVIDGYGGESGNYALSITEVNFPIETAADTCPPDSVFSQLVADPSGNWNAGTSDARQGLIRFEQFTSSAGAICDVHWWGLNAFFDGSGFISCLKSPDQYAIAFYEDDGGRPGALACGGQVVNPTKTNTGLVYSGFPLYRYDVDLIECCPLSSGWISIQGTDTGQDCWFLWSSSHIACGASYAQIGGGRVPDNLDLSLCLTGESPGACCIPDGSCVNDTTPSACDTLGGRHLGLGSACAGDGNFNGMDDACECAKGDFNCDACVDDHDYPPFNACIDGPAAAAAPGCPPGDFDDNSKVSLKDFADFQEAQGPASCFAGNGACCLPSGACAITDGQSACTVQGGTFFGVGTNCLDSDGDRIPNVFESNDCPLVRDACHTGTDPAITDTDGDGINDGDEVYGTLAGLNLPALGADACHKDIFVEADWHNDSYDDSVVHTHRPNAAAIGAVITAFAKAPVANPDGTTGIAIHVDYGQGGPFSGGNQLAGSPTFIVFDSGFNAIKAANFAANRKGYFHYAVFSHRHTSASNGSSGIAELNGDDFMVTLQIDLSNSSVSKTLMHELGHNLNLQHGGFEALNYKPSYNSVMNYRFQFSGVDGPGCNAVGDGLLDYSSGTRITLNENALNENAGVCGAIPIDWNGGGISNPVARNINCEAGASTGCGTGSAFCYDSSCNVLADYDDWANIVLNNLAIGDRAAIQIISCQDTPDHE